MHGELPQFKRCCCCIPLRRGLIGYGYLKVALSILNAAYLIWLICLFYFIFRVKAVFFMLFILGIVLLDCAFSVLLIVAGHVKSPKLMRASYICSIVWLCVEMVISAGIIWVSVQRLIFFWHYGHMSRSDLAMEVVIGFTLAFTTLVVQGYVILLTRSEMIKLQNQSLEMQFTNRAADADGEARCVRAEKHDISTEITIVDS